MKAKAPGKLILSGEHAVVYGSPAIVIAIDRYAYATADASERDRSSPNSEPELRVSAPQILGTGHIPIHQLQSKRIILDKRHAEFLAGDRQVGDILTDYLDLAYYCAAIILSEAEDSRCIPATELQLATDIPIGCGMGSSAAIIAAILGALAGEWGLSPPSSDVLFEWTLAGERLQHGRPSGVDPYIVTHGGCIRFQKGQATPLHGHLTLEFRGQTTNEGGFSVVMTGVPDITTGESVAVVGKQFLPTDSIWDSFTHCTEHMQTALLSGDRHSLHQCIRENHRLLCHIGVVPEPVQRFVERVEACGGAAKVCGAGATSGNGAGAVFVSGLQRNTLNALCSEAGYTLFL